MKQRSSLLLLVALGVFAGATISGPLAAQSGSKGRAVTTTRLDHRELAADQQVLHALNRLTFGARPGDVQKVRAMGLNKWIDQQLQPERIDDSSLEQFLSHYSILHEDQNQLLQNFAVAQRDRRLVKRAAGDTTQSVSREDSMAFQSIALKRRAVGGQLQSSRVARAVIGNRQLDEVMTDFWLNHFNVFIQKGPPEAYYLAEYERDVIRPNALGKFRDLLEAVAKSPAMLFYLDNARSMADSARPRLASFDRNQGLGRINAAARVSVARGRRPNGGFGMPARGSLGGQMNAPQAAQLRQRLNKARSGGLNENYGRELLELHTLGVDGGYSQQDVINVARALTGWTIKPPATGGGFIFRPEMHDAGEKTVLGHKLTSLNFVGEIAVKVGIAQIHCKINDVRHHATRTLFDGVLTSLPRQRRRAERIFHESTCLSRTEEGVGRYRPGPKDRETHRRYPDIKLWMGGQCTTFPIP